MSIIDGKHTGVVDDFERLKLVATLATMIYADPGGTSRPAEAVLIARCILSAADDSLTQNPDLRLADEDEVK
jgi:hypothetical protein